jgi:ribose-phosphate pyrophosphokinase
MGTTLTKATIARFADGESRIVIEESVRAAKCYVLQSTCRTPTGSVNDHLIEMLGVIDALTRTSTDCIVPVIPYFGYARQDCKTQSREPIMAKLVANLIQTSGAGQVIALDLHSKAIQGFFDLSLDHLDFKLIELFCRQLVLDGLDQNSIIISPDSGGVKRADKIADALHRPIAVTFKRRPDANEAEVIDIAGKVEGLDAVIVDDMIDTANTIIKGSQVLLNEGAKSVSVFASHGVFSKNALQRLQESPIKSVTVTNSIPPPLDYKSYSKLRYLSVARLLANAIIRNYLGKSITNS